MSSLYQLSLFPLEKRCSRCGLTKPAIEFYYDRSKADGLDHECRSCSKARARELADIRRRSVVSPDSKLCPVCREVKPGTDFSRSAQTADGLQWSCKRCRWEHERVRRGCKSRRQDPAQRADLRERGLKLCGACKQIQPLEAYYRNRGTYDGLTSWCKLCIRAAVKARADANPDRSRAYYAANRERLCAHMRLRARIHRLDRLPAKKAWEAAHPEWVRAYNKKRQARRRARLQRAPGHHTVADILAIYEKQNGRCAYCRCALGQSYHVDHMLPLARGGSNWPSNLCCACASCNSRKRDRTAEEFRALGPRRTCSPDGC